MPVRSVCALLCACALPALLGACASQPRSASAEPSPAPVAAASTPGKDPNRFEMTRNGKRMTADDFDAWMKARGIRIASGKAEGEKKAPVRKPAKGRSVSSSQRGAAQR